MPEATAGGDPLDYEVDGGPTRLTSPILQLQGNNATVSYWRWYRIGGTLDDQLVVEVSNDNGGSWVTVETLSEPETWTFVEWRVDEYVTPTNEVRVRFTASDETNNSLVEALVDDFVATMDECTQPMGNGDFDEDDDVDLTDFARFQECFEQYPLPSACGPGDMNGSGRVDATDYALFVDALEGLR